MKTWNEFIAYLETEINWDEPTQEQCLKVEEALKKIIKYPEEIQQRCREIATNEELFNDYKSHNQYPRITMDKFMLHMDTEDRFRVRLHRFKSKKHNGESVPKVHSHKWIYSTIILAGSYREKLWKVLETNEDTMEAKLELIDQYMLNTGDTNSGLLDYAHQTINDSDDEHCITLFIRGKTLQKGAKIFNLDQGTFSYTFSPDKQLKEAYTSLSNYQFTFLP